MDYPSGPNLITKVLISRGREKDESTKHIQSNTAGFEDGRGPLTRMAATRSWKWSRNGFSIRTSRKECGHVDNDFGK